MLLAHRWGFLKPYYSQGVRSIIAETAMLAVLAAEITADYARSELAMEASFAPLLQPHAAQDLHASLSGAFDMVRDRALLDIMQRTPRSQMDLAGLQAVFEQLEKEGFFKALNENTERVLRASGWRDQAQQKRRWLQKN